jgi:hypothetical protein
MAYYVTPDLGLELADPLTIQAFETVNVNSNFELLEAGIVADRVRLTAVEGDIGVLEPRVDGLYSGTALTSQNLDSLTTTGLYLQGTNASATLARNYPIDNVAGLLSVKSSGSGGNLLLSQVFRARPGTSNTGELLFERGQYAGGTWTPWRRVTLGGPTAMQPSAVGGATISHLLDGVVSFSAATSVTLQGCFTDDFDEYEIIIDCTNSVASELQFRLANTLAPVSTAEYDNTKMTFVGATVASVQTLNATEMQIAPISMNGRHSGRMLITRPFLSDRTLAYAQFASYPSAPSASHGGSQVASHFSTATSFDGFRLFPSAGNVTGSLRVIGLS